MVMKISAAVELVWELACQESVAAQFETIEPEHFFAALLKFAELPIEELAKLDPEGTVQGFMDEVKAVRANLAGRSIESTRVRRELRRRAGTRNHVYQGGVHHRSAASRQVFEGAGRLAAAEGSETLTPNHLMNALFASPTALMLEVLGGAVAPAVAGPSKTPLLDEHGRDLVASAGPGELPAAPSREAECKALLRCMAQKEWRLVLLVSEGEEAAKAVVGAASRSLGGEGAGQGLKGKRIVDVTSLRPPQGGDAEATSALEKIFAEAAADKDVILFIPGIGSWDDTESGRRWAEWLQGAVARQAVRCLCRVAPAVFEEHIRKDPAWRALVQAMWVGEDAASELPDEL